LEYAKYAYWRYCHEVENGQRDAARAVLEGVADAVARKYGPWQDRRRALVMPLQACFETVRRIRGWAKPR
jgi:hypothetical protein